MSFIPQKLVDSSWKPKIFSHLINSHISIQIVMYINGYIVHQNMTRIDYEGFNFNEYEHKSVLSPSFLRLTEVYAHGVMNFIRPLEWSGNFLTVSFFTSLVKPLNQYISTILMRDWNLRLKNCDVSHQSFSIPAKHLSNRFHTEFFLPKISKNGLNIKYSIIKTVFRLIFIEKRKFESNVNFE